MDRGVALGCRGEGKGVEVLTLLLFEAVLLTFHVSDHPTVGKKATIHQVTTMLATSLGR